MKERNGLWTFCIATGVALVTIACSTTTFQSTWRSPDARPLRLAGRKVAAVFISKNATFRRRAEDALAREISARGAQGVPAYTVLSDDEVKDQAVAREKFEKLVYSLEQDQLVWAGVSRTVDPQQVDSFIAELAAAVSDQMAKDGLLTKS